MAPAIRCFVAVAQTRSFRGASELLSIAASAIHRQIGLLEAHLSVSLFVRGRGRAGVTLTAAGERLLYRVQLATDQVGIALQEIDSLRGATTGKVVLGTTDALARDVFAVFLPIFLRDHPKVAVEVHVLDRRRLMEALNETQLDVALCFDLPVQLGLRVVAEFQMLPCAVIPRGHQLADKPYTTLGECAQYKLALPIEGINLPGMLTQMNAAARIRPNVVLTTNSFVTMRDAVAAGIGISIQTPLTGAFANPDPALAYVPLRDKMARYSMLSCCIPTTRKPTAEASVFVSELQRALHEQLGPPLHPPAGAVVGFEEKQAERASFGKRSKTFDP